MRGRYLLDFPDEIKIKIRPSRELGSEMRTVGLAGQQPDIFGALPLAALSPQPFHSSHETDA